MALRVLLADESSTIKRVMQLALQDFGVEVKAVPVGLDVLPVTKTFKPDIIFADVLLAKRNGYDVCADLKGDAETQEIPVVLMWSGFMEVDETKLSQSQPDARLEKPFDAEALRQLVQDLVPKTQDNPVSAYLQFPKMPEFKETPVAAPLASRPAAKPTGKIPDAAPINFDQFDPHADEDADLFNIPEEDSHPGLTRTNIDIPMIDSPDIDPEKGLRAVATDEEFASVPLNSSQQKDQLEDDGWQRQDLKKFKIQIPAEIPASLPTEDDFAKKFVIPQDNLANAPEETEGEFEELHFGEDLTTPATRATPPPSPTPAAKAPQIQTKASPKASVSAAGQDREMIERVIREEAREVIESICWKVIPEIAERIVREEINKILRDVEKSN